MAKDSFCYVYIVGYRDNSYSIKYTLDADKDIFSLSKGSILLYYRKFDNIADGIAYKLFLSSISGSSIESIISKENPLFADISKQYFQEGHLVKTKIK